MMKKREQLFDHPSQLNTLSSLPFFRMSGLGTLKLGGTIIEHSERMRWERELNKHYYACGCSESAAAMLIGLLLGGAWTTYAYFNNIYRVGGAIGIVVVITIGAAIIGKLYGLLQANRKLKQTIRIIQAQWKPEENPEGQHLVCG